MGILAMIIPFLGFIFGIIGMVFAKIGFDQINKSADGGKGLAVAGLICSIIGTVLQFFVVLGFLAFYFLTASS